MALLQPRGLLFAIDRWVLERHWRLLMEVVVGVEGRGVRGGGIDGGGDQVVVNVIRPQVSSNSAES